MAVIQTKKAVTGTTISFTQNPYPGNLVVVGVARSGSAFVQGDITDNQGNTYTFIRDQSGNGGTDHGALFYAKKILSSGTFTITFPGLGTIVIAEYSGIDTVSPLDKQTSTSGSSTTPNSGNITTTSDSELFIGLSWSLINGDAWTAASPFTLEQNETDNNTNERIAYSDYIGVAGTYSAGFTTTSNNSWLAIISSFKMKPQSLNNYQFISVGNGMSVGGDKIR